MLGKIRLTVVFTNGTEEAHVVDSIFGYDYHGDYFVVHQFKDGVTHDIIYPLRDVREIVKEGYEKVH